jgi:hypothetical protein
MCWPNPFHASQDIKCISKCVDQIHPISGSTENVSQLVLTKPSHASADWKFITPCVDQILPMPATTHNISELALNKPLPYQGEHKIYFNLCWQNPSHAMEDTKCNLICVAKALTCLPGHTKYIPTCVDKIPPMTARTQNVYQLLLTKPLPRQWRHKLQLIMCWSDTSHPSEL